MSTVQHLLQRPTPFAYAHAQAQGHRDALIGTAIMSSLKCAFFFSFYIMIKRFPTFDSQFFCLYDTE